MDKETKSFFEKLAGINPNKTRNNLGAVKNNKKVGREEDENFSETLEEINNNSLPEIFEDAEGQLTIDVYQNPKEFIVESTIAGVKPEDIDISITPESIMIKGRREKEEKIQEGDYLYQECYWGRFTRSIILPQEIDPDSSQATIKNGVLKVVLPKINKQKTKKIKVRFE